MKQLTKSNMTDIEALILTNQTIILGALRFVVPQPVADKLNDAVNITTKLINSYEYYVE